MEDLKEELKSRIIEPFAKSIDCQDGWLPLLAELHDEVVEIDPNYRLYQVKQKFGRLCFYYAISNPELYARVQEVVRRYEDMSLSICERTGKSGKLMVRHGFFQTLNESFKEEGWEDAGSFRRS